MPDGQHFRTARPTCAHCKEPFTARIRPGRPEEYCSARCRREAKLERDRNRPRPYGACARCKKRKSLRWNDKFCSALCLGVDEVIRRYGVTPAIAENYVKGVLADSETSKEAKEPCSDCDGLRYHLKWCRWAAITSSESQSIPDGTSVVRKETYLGGDKGPREGRTVKRIPVRKLDAEAKAWLAANKGWWKTPKPEPERSEDRKVSAFLATLHRKAATISHAA